jgi:hypothetical protein
VRKLSGGPPDAATAAARALASGEVTRLLDVQFTDERGRPWGGVEVEVTLPGEGPKQAQVSETGRLLRMSAAAGTAKVAFPSVTDPARLARRGG